MSNLVKRTLSALILGPLFVYLSYHGGILFFALIFLMFIAMFYEWLMITKTAQKKLLWFITGFLYLGFGCFIMLGLNIKREPLFGLEEVPVFYFIIVFLVWINDIFSYVFGRMIGGPKLAPRISPNKTWAGAIGGVVSCIAFFFIINPTMSAGLRVAPDKVFYSALVIAIVPILALIGDLLESAIKRKFGVKDAGSIIPGHGGVLDRMDGMMMVMNVLGIAALVTYILFSGKVGVPA